MPEKDLLTLQDVVDILDLPVSTIQSWIKKGLLTPVINEGEPNFYPHDIRRLFEEQLDEKASRPKKILVLDDDPLVGQSLRNLLEKEGYKVAVVMLGLAALDRVVTETFDLMITDIRMPGMNGLEAIKAVRELRQQFGKGAIPEIIITGYDEAPVKEEAQRMGIQDFILKPFENEFFLTAVHRKLNRKKGRLHPATP